MPRFERRPIRQNCAGIASKSKHQHKEIMMQANQGNQTYWVGIDWGQEKHVMVICDNAHSVVARFKIAMTLDGLDTLVRRLQAYDIVGGIAIESTRNLVIVRLLEEGYAVYPINPKLSSNWRKCVSVADVKSDDRDAIVLATELSRRHESLKTLCKKDRVSHELLGLCNALRSLIDQRTSHLQRLEGILQRYYPAALDFWSDLGSSSAWAFVKKFSTPQKLAKTRKVTLIAFLRACRIGLRPCWLKRIEQSQKAATWPVSLTADGDEAIALACVSQLQALEPQIHVLEKKISEKCKAFEEWNLIESLPGAGKRLAPAITAIIVNLDKDNGDILQQLRCVAGVAPVQDESGKRVKTVMRRRCNKRWRNIFHLFAWCSTRHSAWAQAFYRLCRKQGNSYASALRKLADKWIRIIVGMIREKQPYDEQKYIAALQIKGSPICEGLCG